MQWILIALLYVNDSEVHTEKASLIGNYTSVVHHRKLWKVIMCTVLSCEMISSVVTIPIAGDVNH